ncbi:MAG: sterol desaturase family protein [Bacteroidetes bacterium]|nr:sterol desaturase family protein [Bacteroidota bacterium]
MREPLLRGLVFRGFAGGYSFYLLIHYAVHRYRPPKGILKFWWTHHALHHYKSDDAAFAVSNPFWDYLFGTMPNRRKLLQRTTENQLKQ